MGWLHRMSEGLSRHIGVLYRPTGKIKCKRGGIKSRQGRGDLKRGLRAHCKVTGSEEVAQVLQL